MRHLQEDKMSCVACLPEHNVEYPRCLKGGGEPSGGFLELSLVQISQVVIQWCTRWCFGKLREWLGGKLGYEQLLRVIRVRSATEAGSENISRWLSWEAKGKVCTMWWLSQKMGLRGACSCLVCCCVLNSYHVITDFNAFAMRGIFNNHFNSYRTVWLYSVLNFIGGLLKNWHLQNEIAPFQGCQALFSNADLAEYRSSNSPF